LATQLKALIEELYAPSPPSILYHYTTLKGLLGIVRSCKIWATDSSFLGDRSELRALGQAISNQIAQRIERPVGNAQVKLLVQLRDWLKDRIENGPFLFIASFTENGNLLSQWRGYCPVGKGVSLGFNSDELAKSVRRDEFRIAKCIYDHKTHQAIANTVLDAFVSNTQERGEAPSNRAHPSQSFHPAFYELEEYLFTIAALLKDASFAEEKEWRIISRVHSNYVEPQICYREGSNSLIPYMEISLPTSGERRISLSNVFVGPTPNPKEAITGVARYLSKYASCMRVSNSMSPYRSL
jgi:hypothetical protein